MNGANPKSFILEMSGSQVGFQQLRSAFDEGQLSEAIGRRVLSLEATADIDSRAIFELASELLENGEYETTIQCTNVLLEFDPSHADYWVLKASALLYRSRVLGDDEKSGMLRHSLGCSEQAIALAPNDPLVLAQKATVLSEMNELESALQLINRAIAIDSTIGFIWWNRGRVMLLLGQSEEAFVSLEKAVSLGEERAMSDLAVAKKRMGQGH